MACRGVVHFTGSVGGANLSGGDFAKGIPRNLLTGMGASGREVDIPKTRPSEMVAVGAVVGAATTHASRARLDRRNLAVNMVWSSQKIALDAMQCREKLIER